MPLEMLLSVSLVRGNQRVRLGLSQLVSAYSLTQNTIESAKTSRNKLVHNTFVYQPNGLNIFGRAYSHGAAI